MELLIGFIIFIAAMVSCLILGITTVAALIVGLIVFIGIGKIKGFTYKELGGFTAKGVKSSLVVAEVLLLIGFITAIWRTSGTISFFVYYGIKLISPNLFILITFLLSAILAYALGTSFGVAGTVGVIFMSLARSGNVDEIITAGAVMSGVFFGDRGSPVSSSAILVATITDTNLIDNVKRMFKTAILPIVICIVAYGILSYQNPINGVDETILNALGDEFNISVWTIIPAICMVVLPLFRINVIWALTSSIVSGILISVLVQGNGLLHVVEQSIFGYSSEHAVLSNILNGGGLTSMIEVIFIVMLSSSYSGIFDGTKMLSKLEELLGKMVNKTGKFFVMVLMSFFTVGVFCNQTIASIMCCDLMKNVYDDNDGSKEELALDIENSAILIASIVPWSIACIVPLSFLGVGFEAIPYSIYLYVVPICYGLTKKYFRYKI
ncbi:MAG: Na+/H+ antiporter NhaC family protein [Peptostreptococcaceae bacterium]|nr:Na+/H+ antiporter NhaC family protein [Peptostreptococcaceae bacterium]